MDGGRFQREALVQDLRPGAVLAGYRIESIEREDGAGTVLRAQDPARGRIVALHVAAEPPGAVSAVRFLERATRLQGVTHPNLVPVFDARALGGRALAIAEAPPGRRLDAVLQEGPMPPSRATRIAAQVASAVEALEGAGAELPPLTPERVWIEAERAYLDPLDGRSLLARSDRPPSSPAAVAGLLETMVSSEPSPLREIVARARDGAYFSVAQVTDALRGLEACSLDSVRRRRRVALLVAAVATVLLVVLIVVTAT
jgi:hypothetical protein